MANHLMFAEEITDTLPELRAYAESLMTLTVLAEGMGLGPDGEGIISKVPVSKGTSCAKVAGGSQAARDGRTRYVTVGGVTRPVLDGGLHLPLDSYLVGGVLQIVCSEDPAEAWRFTVTAAGCGVDPSMIGRKYQAISVPAKSFATARRLDVVEV